MAVNCDPSSLAHAARCFSDCCHGRIEESIKTNLLCQWTNNNAPVAPAVPTNIDIADASSQSNTIVTWANTDTPTNNEIWKSTNGGAFALLATVAGNIHTFTDVTAMPVETIYTYKVRATNGAAASAFTSTVSAAQSYTSPTTALPDLVQCYGYLILNNGTGTAYSLPLCRQISGGLQATANLTVTSFSAPVLVSTGDFFDVSFSTALTSFSANSLHSVGANFTINNCTSLVTLSLPSLSTVVGTFDGFGNTSLTTLSVLGPMFVSSGIDFNGCTALANVTLTNWTPGDGATYNFSNCAILVGNGPSMTGIDGILRACALQGLSTADIELAGGTNAPPDASGQTSKTFLIANGCTVNTN